MFAYLPIFTALAVPILLYPLKTFRSGLVSGLFLCLVFLCADRQILTLIPLSVSVYLFFAGKKRDSAPLPGVSVKKPGTPMLTVFFLSMIVFCAFGDSFYNYGVYLQLDENVLAAGRRLSGPGLLAGPVLFGSWCDRKGPFGACVGLALLSELSVLLAGSGYEQPMLFLAGNVLIYICISGFFVLMPELSKVFFGKSGFYRVYLPMAAASLFIWIGTRSFYSRFTSLSLNPGDFLLNLLLLVIVSVFSVVLAWKRRLVLVTTPASSEKAAN